MEALSIVALAAKRPATAPRTRPVSARVSSSKQESLSDFVLLQGRLLAKAHANVIKPITAPQPPRPQAPLDMLAMPSPSAASPTTLSPISKHKDTDFTLGPVESTGPLPLSITVVMRKRQGVRVEQAQEAEISLTPDQTTTYNSDIMKEYQGLMKGVGVSCGMQTDAFRPTLQRPTQKRIQGVIVEEVRRKRYSSTRRAEKSNFKPERKQTTPRYRFAKRALSGSFHAPAVFDPRDIYNVSNGTIRVT